MPEAPGIAATLPRIDAWRWARLEDGRFRVRGYTDAMSPAGERHRTYYQCDLVQLHAGRWRLDSLTVSAAAADLSVPPGPATRASGSPGLNLGASFNLFEAPPGAWSDMQERLVRAAVSPSGAASRRAISVVRPSYPGNPAGSCWSRSPRCWSCWSRCSPRRCSTAHRSSRQPAPESGAVRR